MSLGTGRGAAAHHDDADRAAATGGRTASSTAMPSACRSGATGGTWLLAVTATRATCCWSTTPKSPCPQANTPTSPAASTGPRACAPSAGPSTGCRRSSAARRSASRRHRPSGCRRASYVTPDLRDAERLQGFPVDWTAPAEEVAKARRALADGRQLGERARRGVDRPSARRPRPLRRLRRPAVDGRQVAAPGGVGGPRRCRARRRRRPVARVARRASRWRTSCSIPGRPLSARAASGFLRRTQGHAAVSRRVHRRTVRLRRTGLLRRVAGPPCDRTARGIGMTRSRFSRCFGARRTRMRIRRGPAADVAETGSDRTLASFCHVAQQPSLIMMSVGVRPPAAAVAFRRQELSFSRDFEDSSQLKPSSSHFKVCDLCPTENDTGCHFGEMKHHLSSSVIYGDVVSRATQQILPEEVALSLSVS